MKPSTPSTGETAGIFFSQYSLSLVVIALTNCRLSSCIRGRLLEVNENILETPALLLEKVNIYSIFSLTSYTHFNNMHTCMLLIVNV